MTVRTRFYRRAVCAAAMLTLAGCSSPLDEASTQTLRESVIDSVQRELDAAAKAPEPRLADRQPGAVQFDEREMQLLRDEGIYPPSEYGIDIGPMGPDLLGDDTALFQLTLRQSIAAAVEHNLSIASARLAPAISATQVTEAEAAFDWVFFANVTRETTDRENQVPLVGGIPVGAAGTRASSTGFETGLRRRLTTNGTLAISAGQTHSNLKSTGTSLSPDPAESTFLQFDLSQPLLRSLGSDVSLAEVRLARNLERRDIHALHATLIRTVTDVETAYWDLFFAMRNLQVQQALLDRGLTTRRQVENRSALDTMGSQIADARATVEERRAAILRARNRVRQSSDRLKSLINDPELTVGSEVVMIPIDTPIDAPITYSLLDSLTTAFARRPEVQQAVLNIDDAAIRQRVADNARLPILDLSLRARYQGLDDDATDAWEEIGEGDYINYLVGLNFEQALGNRGPEAAFRRAQLQRMDTVVGYRTAIQSVTLDVKIALRDVLTNYRLIEQARSSRLAAAESLRTHRAREKIDGLTPTNLDIRFRRQESLALAELREVQALLDYNTAIANLHAAMATSLQRNGIAFEVEEADGE